MLDVRCLKMNVEHRTSNFEHPMFNFKSVDNLNHFVLMEVCSNGEKIVV
jgi:hypothetical protein